MSRIGIERPTLLMRARLSTCMNDFSPRLSMHSHVIRRARGAPNAPPFRFNDRFRRAMPTTLVSGASPRSSDPGPEDGVAWYMSSASYWSGDEPRSGVVCPLDCAMAPAGALCSSFRRFLVAWECRASFSPAHALSRSLSLALTRSLSLSPMYRLYVSRIRWSSPTSDANASLVENCFSLSEGPHARRARRCIPRSVCI